MGFSNFIALAIVITAAATLHANGVTDIQTSAQAAQALVFCRDELRLGVIGTEAVAKGSIRYCPVCDGYEAADQRIGILGHGEDASSKARFLRTYSNEVTLLSLDKRGSGNTETARSLREAGIKIAGPVHAIEHGADGMRAVLRSGKVMSMWSIRR
jgi:thioredoxin reductase